jgi:phosphoribosylformimino-5-aminoimidazole carboxamide ribotide isomerase
MRCYPAIDIRDGRCVRLLRGDFAAETVYGDPLEVALAYARAGAEWLHVVDLDAARTGLPANRELVLAIAGIAEVKVQAGGGVRDADAALALLEGGVERVVLGTAAVEDPLLIRRLAAEHPGRVALALDHTAGPAGARVVAVRGWEEDSGRGLESVLADVGAVPLGAVVVTDVSRDGTMSGPDLAGLAAVLELTTLPVVASGGIAGAADLRTLSAMVAGGRRLGGAIVGRALLGGALTIGEALAACAT